jgi:HEPN domain-containing protein
MSVEKQRHEAQRWLDTAAEDLDVARLLLDGGKPAHSCFAAQQAGEKAAKAIRYLLDAGFLNPAQGRFRY